MTHFFPCGAVQVVVATRSGSPAAHHGHRSS